MKSVRLLHNLSSPVATIKEFSQSFLPYKIMSMHVFVNLQDKFVDNPRYLKKNVVQYLWNLVHFLLRLYV